MKTRRRLTVVVVAVLFVILVMALHREPAWQAYADDRPITPNNVAGVWLNRPDAIIRSESLSELPADLLRVPVLKDVLTEDFLFYYDNDEDWLGLKGSIRRIAYEHDLDLGDKLVSLLLDRQADVYLWRDGKGALRHQVLTLQRDTVVGMAEKLLKVMLKGDRQLQKLGEFAIGGAIVPVLALKLSPRRTYVVLTHQDRLAVLSSSQLVLSAKGTLDESFVAAATRWLAPEEKDRIGLFEGYQLPAQIGGRHSLLLSSRFLSQGYSVFFPELAALRFDFANSQWATQGLFNLPAQEPAAVFNRNVWQQMPVNPATCAMIPANWVRMDRFLPGGQSFNKAAALKVTQQLQPSGAVCWYADARLYEPLFIATFKDKTGDSVNKSLEQLFDWAVATTAGTSGEDAEAVEVTREDNGTRWSRRIPVDAERNPTLARVGNTLYFSVNADLIDTALAVQKMRYPALSDAMSSAQGTVLLHTDTAKLSALLEQEVRHTVSPGSEDAAIVDSRLMPRLQALAKHGQINLVLPSGALQPGRQWQPLSWKVL